MKLSLRRCLSLGYSKMVTTCCSKESPSLGAAPTYPLKHSFNGWGLPFTQRWLLLAAANESPSLVEPTYLDKGEWWRSATHLTLTKESFSRTTPFLTAPSSAWELFPALLFYEEEGGDGVRTSHILPRKFYFTPKVSSASRADQDACPLGSGLPFLNHSPPSGRRTGGRDPSWSNWSNRPFRVGMWLFAMCDPGNESWSTSLTILPSYGKHIIRKSEETIASMQYM